MRSAVTLIAALTVSGVASAQDAVAPASPDLQTLVADLTRQNLALSARIDDLKKDVEELKRVAPITLFVPGSGTVGAVAADAACTKAKYQGAIAVRPATGGSTVLCVSIAAPGEKPLH